MPLTVESSPILRLEISYRFRLGRDLGHLRVDSSSIQVWSMAKGPALFRYDYLASPESGRIPVAHVQIHAHRDELLHAMYISDRSRSTPARKKRLDPAEPRGLHMIHFPVGGARFRPCLEDVIELVVNEFGLDTQPGWQERVREGRAQWRRVQLAAAVRDDPATARQALAGLGAEASTDEDRLRRI
ncbi:hypothetical protein NSA19_07180 [Actinomyces bowdenii]|uniref:hypothetical protein n=1 Tax=Actinomyces bowdenii TaxID=131109 RepID=UPI00214AA166|nr:hypothetical protein [Actinomyces bowdenii]MCR2052632.1 hypothetical protein [Actinomyces bowdenii]